MAYDLNDTATINQIKTLALRVKSEIEGAVAALPTEMFLDQTKTQFVSSFSFNSTTYSGATNPNLDGKPVLVLAVKGVDNADPTNTSKQTVTYSFLDMQTLVDTYTAKAGNSAKILNISGYEIEVNISAAANNSITVQNDGLHVDISGKADKVASATAGHVASLDANGNLQDSGIVATNILTTANLATDAEFNEMLTEVFGAAN